MDNYYGYVDVGRLADFANNLTIGLTANEIMRFPRSDVQPIKRGQWENEYLDDDDVWSNRIVQIKPDVICHVTR